MYETICKYPYFFETVLCYNKPELSAKKIDEIFIPILSPTGSNQRILENKCLAFWKDFLLDCEGA